MLSFFKGNLPIRYTVLLLSLVSAACMQTYTGQDFSYPPGSKPHEAGSWTHFGDIYMTKSAFGSEFQLSKRNINIGVWDKAKNRLLFDKISLTSGSIDAEIEWEQFESLRIILFEVGYDSINSDQHSKDLLKEPGGKRQIADLRYVFDNKKDVFVKQ